MTKPTTKPELVTTCYEDFIPSEPRRKSLITFTEVDGCIVAVGPPRAHVPESELAFAAYVKNRDKARVPELGQINETEFCVLKVICDSPGPIMGAAIAGKAGISHTTLRQHYIPRLMGLKLIEHPQDKSRGYVPCGGIRAAVVNDPRSKEVTQR